MEENTLGKVEVACGPDCGIVESGRERYREQYSVGDQNCANEG